MALWVLLLIAGWLLAGCAPAAVMEASPPSRPYTLAVADQFIPTAFVPLDAALAPSGEEPLPPMWLPAGGAIGVSTEHTSGRANPDPATTWIVVHDLPGGGERGRFHPPVSGHPAGISAGGSRLLWQPFPPVTAYPPPLEYYVLDTAAGSVLGHVQDENNACFRQSALFDPQMKRLICVADPALVSPLEASPLRLVAYDVASGARAAELELPDVLVGMTAAQETNAGIVQTFLEPAVAFSPDGRTLVVVDAASERITLIDAASLAVERSFTPRRGLRVWDLLGLGVSPAAAKGVARGTLRHAVFSDDGRLLYVFSQIMREEGETGEGGLRVIDLERERLAADALGGYQVQWVLPAPDGTVYAFGTTGELLAPHQIVEDAPSMLWRLDGRTLAVLAERPFVGYRGGRLISAP